MPALGLHREPLVSRMATFRAAAGWRVHASVAPTCAYVRVSGNERAMPRLKVSNSDTGGLGCHLLAFS